MKYRILSLYILLFSCSIQSKEIAITFDDAPRSNSHYFSGAERTKRIINELKQHDTKAMFFVTTKNLNAKTQQRIDNYHNAGHPLANHSQSHLWLHRTPVKEYIQDILVADKKLAHYKNFQKLYRFPFLDEGRTIEKRDALRQFLKSNGYKNGYVTIDNYDWYMDSLFQKATKDKLRLNKEKLRSFYVDTLVSAANYYNDLAVKHLERSPKHLLLLHENDLAALFIGDLITALKKDGWKIIPPLKAYEDPIATQIPDTLFNGQGRIAALIAEKGVPRKQLIHFSEDEAKLKQLFETDVVTQ
ncbi:polysaccharide deacetylase family protein [Pleionea sp. CnH1-48]|uniref:polysaccharide deacetylase family protein n=1 Tax=Pleionea sp. CnH1-48 TaxID=2954494 RepID=UPI002096C735|nr:polysaccharide deacetylase family protein [Pleionea sp. CnH1-48]